MKTIEKDILTVEDGFILHQVNAQGVMGSGVAKGIRDKWHRVYDEYKKKCHHITEYCGAWALMGHAQIVEVSPSLSVVNLFAQYDYRKNPFDNQQYTEYGSFAYALKDFVNKSSWSFLDHEREVYLPYKIGSDRGGADFSIISEIVKEIIPQAIFCKLPN